MLKARLSRRSGLLALGIALALIAIVSPALTPAFAATGWAECGTVMTKVLGYISPIYKVLKWGISIAAVILAIWEFFKAAKGEGSGWLKGIGLLAVGVICAAPAPILDTLIGRTAPTFVNYIKTLEGSGTNPC